MGALDQAEFERLVKAGCTACGHATLEISSYIDRSIVVMVGDPNNEGRWAHDGEKFVDGTYKMTCGSCTQVTFASDVCPRCNAEHALSRVLSTPSRLAVPKRCPKCNELELLAIALVPAKAKSGPSPKPQQIAEYGEAGYHVVAFACHECDNAVVAERCPLCDAPGPLRNRP